MLVEKHTLFKQEDNGEHLELKNNCYCPCSAIVQNNSNEEQAGYILDLNGFGGCCSKEIGPSRCGYEGYGATLSFSNVTPMYLARSNENIYLHKILSKSVDSIFIQSSPKLDITQMPINSIPVV